MNRIRELIKEHGSDSSGKWVAIDKVELIAKIIVRECIRIDVENRDAAPGVEISKYFGVEE